MKRRPNNKLKRCIVIAGPNGAGKTTFARQYLTPEVGIVEFINADLIAAGLSPLAPANAALWAGRLVLAEIDRHATGAESFAFESTLSGKSYIPRLKRLKALGYQIEVGVFARLIAATGSKAHPGARETGRP